ncbi:MAG: hypothetical protein EA368_08185 [Leptolyngbya sp. DLM2.Bin27]|nr:MAG: hypothetical protein EA368_08185 [Leptolyngbya sp. DLM2.Bin27]
MLLSWLVVGLTLVASGVGLFWHPSGESVEFITLHGQPVDLYGRGLYRFDTAFKAPILRGTDAILLFVGLPTLGVAMQWAQRPSLRGQIVLAGVLSCFLYAAVSLTFGAAYNDLFLVYVAWFSVSLYAFMLAITAVNLAEVSARVKPGLPHRAIAYFLFLTGLSPAVWLIEIVAGLAQGEVPRLLASYTTDVTTALDLGVITPACYLAGILLLRRRPLGYLLAAILLILLILIGLIVAGQSVMQIQAGVPLTGAEVLAYVIPFVGLSLVAVGCLVMLLRHLAAAETRSLEHPPASP